MLVVIIIWTVIYPTVKIFTVEIFWSLFKCSLFNTSLWCWTCRVSPTVPYALYILNIFLFITDEWVCIYWQMNNLSWKDYTLFGTLEMQGIIIIIMIGHDGCCTFCPGDKLYGWDLEKICVGFYPMPFFFFLNVFLIFF